MKCNHCGAEIPALTEVCPDCGAALNEVLPSGELSKPENIPLGILGALIGALIGGASIILLGQAGYVASICGIILAFCTMKGYELLSGKKSIVGMIVSVILVLATPFCAYIVSLGIAVLNEWKDIAPDLNLMQGIQLVFELAQLDPELVESMISYLLQLYLFTGIGVVGYLASNKKKAGK